ncbi:hypothetical protein DKM44_03845 [Deinococcus irradiatisoli]|uniref:Phage tail protein n=1 Tax=Deinococcus irradiatisoli TaxID=2202254 RepID=A0A2Z3JBY0_9DEIO|nr:hypothetical protein [Deinococcus irradiatisoli]AWN22475.1 hypothetical protein DKM44_03845 [Deinococcus irradiatisoli]
MSGEWFWLHTPEGRLAMPGTTRPSIHGVPAISSNLVRARGYTRIHDLADGLPDPVPIIWTGFIKADSEAALALAERELRKLINSATAFDRDDRKVTTVQGRSVQFVPDSDGSNRATFTVTWIPLNVPDPDDEDESEW